MDYSFAAKQINLNHKENNFLPTSSGISSKIYFNLAENINSAFDPFPSIFDYPDKMDSKQYHLFKKISPIKPLSLDLNNKLFEDTVSSMKDLCFDEINAPSEQRIFHIYLHKNYKARLVLIDNGGPKNYLNLNNFRFFPIKIYRNYDGFSGFIISIISRKKRILKEKLVFS